MFMVAFLYLGAGLCMSSVWMWEGVSKASYRGKNLTIVDWKYVTAMIVLDFIAPTLLMYGLKCSLAANASLLGNFEIVATAVFAMIIFHENISRRLWLAIAMVASASVLLTTDSTDGFHFSFGSLLVLGATLCWGLENNCTRQIADKSPVQIVTLKGFGSGLSALVLALLSDETLGALSPFIIIMVLLLGSVSYGMSIFFYTLAQRVIGAARTSTFYAFAPFIGAALSIIFLHESITPIFIIALAIMIFGAVIALKA